MAKSPQTAQKTSTIGYYDTEAHNFTHIDAEVGASAGTVFVDTTGVVWLGSYRGGLFRYAPDTRNVRQFADHPVLSQTVTVFLPTARGTLWIAADRGLIEFDPYSERVLRSVPIDFAGADGTLRNHPLSLARHDDGTLWVGTTNGGLAYAGLLTPRFELVTESAGGLRGPSVRSLWADSAFVWVGLNEHGLARHDRATGRTVMLPESSKALAEDGVNVSVWGLDRDRSGRVWVLTQRGVEQRDHASGEILRTYSFPSRVALPSHHAFMHEDASGRLWYGASSFHRFDPETGVAVNVWQERIPSVAIHETAEGTLWIATLRGLAQFEPDIGATTWHRNRPGDLASLSSDEVISMAAESDSVLWVGTAFGVNRFDVATGTARRFTTFDSDLPDDYINGVVVGNDGGVWVSTNNGLARIDRATGRISVVQSGRGLQDREFNRGAYARAPDGLVAFGGIGGLNLFDPSLLRGNTIAPRPRLLRMRAGDSLVVAAPRPSLPSLRLSAEQNDLVFEFAGLHYADPPSVRYQYRLEGSEEPWQPVTASREARYPDLRPGRYTFTLRAANPNGVWSQPERLASFHLPPPWWASQWFRAALVLALAGALILGFRKRTESLRRRKAELERQVAARTADLASAIRRTEEQAEALRALNAQQKQLFADVSHETRTPLTLIIGPVEQALEQPTGLPVPLRSTLESVHQNARRLLRYVDQILDLARIESGQREFTPARLDLSAFTASVAASFEALAEREGVALSFSGGGERITGQFDVGLLEPIVFNLVTNALRHTPRGGRVEVTLERGRSGDAAEAVIAVRDTGSGIPEALRARIFERYVQAGEGRVGSSGLGLALVKEAVEAHGGSVSAESREGGGTTMRVRIPYRPAPAHPAQPAHSDGALGDGALGDGALGDGALSGGSDVPAAATALSPTSEPPAAHDDDRDDRVGEPDESDDRTTVLVAEDTTAVRAYLADLLRPSYRVLEASDGEEALALVREHLPDLVVSDVVMPRRDGLSLCRTIKQDAALAFIPVVLLTARAELSQRIAGLETGADAYVAKPFSARELLARVEGILANRRAWRAHLSAEPRAALSVSHEAASGGASTTQPAPALPRVLSPDEALRARIDETIRERYAEPGFSASSLADAVGLSAAHLRRKMNELSGVSPTQAIRAYRLEQAAALLARGKGTVSEVGYAVGFNSVSYFSRAFREAYGCPPSAYAAREAEGAGA
jgi:signal transduction histidine kinase/AraC-like DNA-binding protein/streptogramin lyase